MPKKKVEVKEQEGQEEKPPVTSLGIIVDLLKSSKVLQIGLLAIFLAVALAIVMADEISLFGVSIKGAGIPEEEIVVEEDTTSYLYQLPDTVVEDTPIVVFEFPSRDGTSALATGLQ
jgi:hypothetical protein